MDEKDLYGATANDCRLAIDPTQKFEETSQISEDSRNDHQMLARLLGWLTVSFPTRQ